MYFGSDNSSGTSPRFLAALAQANEGNERSYGGDQWSNKAREALARVFNHEIDAHFVTTGTAANALALAALTPSYGAILCHQEAHINVDECGAPEFFTGGAKLLTIPGEGGKITPDNLRHAIKIAPNDVPHNAPLKILSLTQATESGLVYQPQEVAALCKIAKEAGMSVHMDGARFANAVAGTGSKPEDLTWRAGVDVLTLGATKDGALAAEAVIFFDSKKAENFRYLMKRAGQLTSKSRWMGAQFTTWLEDDHWLELARAANNQASYLSKDLRR